MDFLDLVFAGAVLVAVTVIPLVAVRMWRGTIAEPNPPRPAWFPLGERAWRGAARSLVVGAPFYVAAMVGAAVWHWGGRSNDTAGVVSGVSFGVVALIQIWYAWFDRPRFLLPPHMRRPSRAEARRAAQVDAQRLERKRARAARRRAG